VRRPRPRRRLLASAAALLAASLAAPLGGSSVASAADPPQRVAVQIAVHHASQRPGPIDPGAAALEQKLRQDFRFQSVRVLESRRLELALDETGTLALPTGRILKVKPRKIGPTGLLMRVEIEGLLRTNLRVPNHHQVVIGAERYEDGKLVVTLEPDY
jgi:hypothetical protein